MTFYSFPDSANIAVAGDWHGNLRWVSQLINFLATQRDITHIIHVGDFGIMTENEVHYMRCLEEATHRTGVEIYFVRGNHDNPDFLNSLPLDERGFAPLRHNASIPRVFYIPDGTFMTWRGKTILGIGGAVSIDQRLRRAGFDWWPNEVIPDNILDIVTPHIPMDGVDVIISHDATERSAVPLDPAFAAMFSPEVVESCEDHRLALQRVVDVVRPRNLIHGHYHVFYDEEFTHPELAYSTRSIGLDCDKARFSASRAHRHWVNLAEVLGV